MPDSNLGKLAAAEEELKELVKTMSIHGRKWADSKDALVKIFNVLWTILLTISII